MAAKFRQTGRFFAIFDGQGDRLPWRRMVLGTSHRDHRQRQDVGRPAQALHLPGERLPACSVIAIASARLEGFHGDPADCLIVATAQHAAAVLVIVDTNILAWAAVKAGRVQVLAF